MRPDPRRLSVPDGLRGRSAGPLAALPVSPLGVALALLLGGCATLSDGSATPRLARLPPDELARLAPDAPRLSLDDLVAMARAGAPAETLIERFRQAGARFDLTPAQVLDLHARGLPLAVLQAIHDDREKALRADLTQMLVERDEQCASQVAQARQRALAGIDPFCYRSTVLPYPYPWRRGTFFWGW